MPPIDDTTQKDAWQPVDDRITVEFTREALWRFIKILGQATNYQVKWKVVEYEPGRATISGQNPYKDTDE